MRLLHTALVMALALNGIAVAQTLHPTKNSDPALEPTKLLPKSFTLEFENDWVRILRAHYPARTTLPNHEHEPGPIVYLYLNASDGVEFGHADGGLPIPRAPVRPGAIRVATNANVEWHTATNKADTPSDFIRITLKTERQQRGASASARLSPDRMEYDHAVLRVARINVQPATRTRIEAKNYPMLRVAWIPDQSEWRISAKEGYRFLEKGTTEEFEVSGNVPMQIVTIELRTPIAKR